MSKKSRKSQRHLQVIQGIRRRLQLRWPSPNASCKLTTIWRIFAPFSIFHIFVSEFVLLCFFRVLEQRFRLTDFMGSKLKASPRSVGVARRLHLVPEIRHANCSHGNTFEDLMSEPPLLSASPVWMPSSPFQPTLQLRLYRYTGHPVSSWAILVSSFSCCHALTHVGLQMHKN